MLDIKLQDLKHTPLKVWIVKISDRFKNIFLKTYFLKKDKANSSFNTSDLKVRNWFDNSCIDFRTYVQTDKATDLIESYCKHQIDILGRGWIQSAYKKTDVNEFDVRGNWLGDFINHSNLIRSKKIWLEILKINPAYQPLDWRYDSVSGHLFNSKLWYKSPLGDLAQNAEIKVPWELGRLQHIPRMLVMSEGEQNQNRVLTEIQCQLLDFVMSNPPRWGVNWRSTMDVAIRAANISLVFNLLLDRLPDFSGSTSCAILRSSLLDHYYHILGNHERKSGLGNNHYLANIVGLLYTAYSIDEEFVPSTLTKYINELFLEVNKQFLDDGGNFESSTTYHALSTEMCIYGIALVGRIVKDESLSSKINIDRNLYDQAKVKLYKAYHYLETLMNEDGTVPQLGDNDSGRFFKWTFYGNTLNLNELKNKYYITENRDSDNIHFDEDYLNYRSVLNLCKGYFGQNEEKTFEGELIKAISTVDSELSIHNLNNEIRTVSYPKTELKHKSQTIIRFDGSHENNKVENPNLEAFQDTGVYVLQNDQTAIIINGTNCRVQQYWPHGHNDKLSFTIRHKGKEFFRDPGSFTYTGNPKLRNKYRSVNAHNSPNHGMEQNLWIDGKQGVFRMVPRSKVEVLSYSKNSIKLSLCFDGVVHHREWTIGKGGVVVSDESNKPFESNFYPEIRFSNGYGKMLAEFT